MLIVDGNEYRTADYVERCAVKKKLKWVCYFSGFGVQITERLISCLHFEYFRLRESYISEPVEHWIQSNTVEPVYSKLGFKDNPLLKSKKEGI